MRSAPRANPYRDTWAGDLGAERADSPARVSGWVHNRRDHGGLIFVDLRDRSGIVQLVFHPENGADLFAAAERLRAEYVISVAGDVIHRESGQVNPNLATGEIEIQVAEMQLLAESQTPPFPLDSDVELDEMLRLRHRTLDLRRRPMIDALVLRHEVVRTIRETLSDDDFLEIETPILTKSTPEGARDFLVPSRLQPGAFYALPQSPQLFKQLLMVAGYERYFQIARCFRDEDLRADRQPEFTQLDLEMSFVEEDDVIDVNERLMAKVFEVGGLDIQPPPYPRMGYEEAMLRFGSDRPDTRFGLEITDVSDHLRASEFKVFASVLGGGGVVRAINAGTREVPRKELDELTEVAKRAGAGGLVWAFVQEDGTWRSPIAKFLSGEEIAARDRRPRRAARRPAARRRRPGGRRGQRARHAAPAPRRALGPRAGRPPRRAVGRRLPDVRLQRGRAPLGRVAPPVHGADRAGRQHRRGARGGREPRRVALARV